MLGYNAAKCVFMGVKVYIQHVDLTSSVSNFILIYNYILSHDIGGTKAGLMQKKVEETCRVAFLCTSKKPHMLNLFSKSAIDFTCPYFLSHLVLIIFYSGSRITGFENNLS